MVTIRQQNASLWQKGRQLQHDDSHSYQFGLKLSALPEGPAPCPPKPINLVLPKAKGNARFL